MARLRRSLDLIVVLAATWLAAGWTLADGGPGWARIVLGLPLALVWPGYALTMLVCPRRAHGVAQTAAYWVGLSLMLSALGGMALHFTPEGLTARSWALYLGGATTLCCLGAGWRRREGEIHLPTVRQALAAGGWLVMAGGVVVGAILWARWGALHMPQPGFTQFWILPVEDAPEPTWRLGWRNVEHDTQPYRLVVTLEGRQVLDETVRGLEPGMTSETTLTLPEDATPEAGDRIVALLYRGDDQETPYRKLIWWLE